MDPAWQEGNSGHGGEGRPHSLWPFSLPTTNSATPLGPLSMGPITGDQTASLLKMGRCPSSADTSSKAFASTDIDAAAVGDHSHAQESQPKPQPVQELVASLQSTDLQREQDSRDVVCGIFMDKVWDKPEAKRIFGILPNCTHAHCLGCLRTWRNRRQGFPLDVIKAGPQCRVHSSYIIPHRFWVSKGAEKEPLIRNFRAPTSQTPCRFFMRGNSRCPFRCRGPAALAEDRVFPDYALAVAFWGFDLLLDPNSSYHSLL